MSLDTPTALRRRLRIELKKARHAVDLTQKEVADRATMSESKVQRIENGAVSISVNDLLRLLHVYDVTDPGRVQELTEMAKAARGQDQWSPYSSSESPDAIRFYRAESSAALIKSFQIVVIPGLLQTEEYTRAFLRDAHALPQERIDTLIEIRKLRQDLLEREPRPTLHFLIDEAALRRVVGSPAIMRAQLEHLEQENEQPHITIQVIPFPVGAHPGMRGPLVYMEFSDEEEDNMVFLEGAEDRNLRDDPEAVSMYADRFIELEKIAAPADALNRFTRTAIEKLPAAGSARRGAKA